MPGEIKNKIGTRPPQKKRSEAESKRIKEILDAGRRTPFWQYLVQRLNESIASDRQALESLVPVGENAGLLAQAQGRLQVANWLKNLPEIELGEYDPLRESDPPSQPSE